MKQIDGNYLDLSQFPKLMMHSTKENSFTKYIVDNEINKNIWYDELLENLSDNSVIVDAGANVGLFTLYMLPKIGNVYCIEPMLEHVEVLLSLPFTGNVWMGALSNKDGVTSFNIENSNTTMNSINESGEVSVNCMTLNSFFKSQNIKNVDLLKLDIEGGEELVINQDPTVDESLLKCKLVFIETHPEPWGNCNEKELVKKMESLNFKTKVGKREHSFYFINQN